MDQVTGGNGRDAAVTFANYVSIIPFVGTAYYTATVVATGVEKLYDALKSGDHKGQ
jgi:hypothetical protein